MYSQSGLAQPQNSRRGRCWWASPPAGTRGKLTAQQEGSQAGSADGAVDTVPTTVQSWGVCGPGKRSFVRQYWLMSVTAHLYLHTTFHYPNNFHKLWFLSFSPQCFLCPEWRDSGDADHSTDCPFRNVPGGRGGWYGVGTEARLLFANLAGHWEHEGESMGIAPGWAPPRHPGS